jgi:hypothetical protein
MAYFMFQACFTAEAWAKMVREPQNREQSIRPVIEKLGGKLIGYWFAAGGAVASLKTTALMSVEESMQAMRKAGAAGYRAPS